MLYLEKKIADATKTLAVMRGDTVRGESRNVLARRVAGVVVSNIVRISPAEPGHEEIARDLGKYGRAGDAETAGVAVDDRGVRDWQRPHQSSIDHDMIGRDLEPSERAVHRERAGLVDVDAVDLAHRCRADCERDRALADLSGKPDALVVGQSF